MAQDFDVNEFISTSIENDVLFDEKFSFVEAFKWNEIYSQEFNRDLCEDINFQGQIIWKKYRLKTIEKKA